ncbi:MAG TPA: HupE/UreJ family protein [Aliidongia sp.]|nr:HupE/UreJ family protein [Aliidongia sp.]
MLRRLTPLIAALSLCALICPPAADAHDLPLDRVMNGFIEIEPHEAHLIVHVPLDLLRSVQFSLDQGRYDIAASGPPVETALSALAGSLSLWENGVRLAPSSAVGRLSPLADRSFETYEQAVDHIAEPPDPDMKIMYEMGYLDARFTYPIASAKSAFAVETNVAADLGSTTKLMIRYLPPGEAGRAIIITSEDGRVALDPAWYQASGGFIRLGIEHILSGIDHLLFLLCLVIPFRRITALIPVITAFTLGHSVTLIGTAYGLAPAGAWFSPFIETGIAASILYMALENIVGADLRHRWIIAGVFGLVHGFGFSSALKDQLQFAGSHLLVSLFSFNIGIEIGQLAILCLFVALLALLFRGAMAGRMGIIVLSALVAHTAWHWMIERGELLWQTPWPAITASALMGLGRWAAALAIAIGAAILLSRWIERKWPKLVQPAGYRADG